MGGFREFWRDTLAGTRLASGYAVRRLPCNSTRGILDGMGELWEDAGTYRAMFAEPDSPESCPEDSCFREWDGAALVSFGEENERWRCGGCWYEEEGSF